MRPAGATEAANTFVTDMFQRKANKGRISPQEADAAIGNLVPCTELSDIADCDIVVEAIIEDLDIKQRLFADLEAMVAPFCNTRQQYLLTAGSRHCRTV